MIKSLIKNNASSSRYKKFWISIDGYKLDRVEFYTSSGRLFRVINCSNYFNSNGVVLPSKIHIQDFKTKNHIQVEISDFDTGTHFDANIFIPEDQ